MTATSTGPNVKALRRILCALVLAAMLCFGICLTLVLRQDRVTPAPHKLVHRCTCAGCPR